MRTSLRLSLTGILLLSSSALVMANSITYVTPTGSTDLAGETVNASAMFTTSTDQVTIVLTNLLTSAQMISAGQAISDLSFTLSGDFQTGLVDSTDRSYTADFINIAGGPTPPKGTATSTTATADRWFFSNVASTFLLEDLGAGQPKQTIVGSGGTACDPSPAYCNANSSIAGNGPHNPFIDGTATFTLNITGVTDATNITGAIFSFGTAACDATENPGTCITGTSEVPEPSASGVFVAGAALIAAVFYRRRSVVAG
jgi:hypothetical protein